MARFKCWECGKEFDEYKESQECIGEFWGISAFQTEIYCPYCGGDFDKKEEVDMENEKEREISRLCMMESARY